MAAALEPQYFSLAKLAARPRDWWQSVLGVVGFARPPRIDPCEVPLAASMTPHLRDGGDGGDGGDVCEVWRLVGGASPAAAGDPAVGRRLTFRRAGPWLFGSLRIAEEEFACAIERSIATTQGGAAKDVAATGRAALVRATELAYREIFASIRAAGHPHLVRVWNYLPEINAQVDGDERYRHFNAARKSAFLQAGEATAGTVPAACALGSDAGNPLSIYFLAARQQPIAIENPRQTSAYLYPRRYGEQPPIFARASLLPGAGNLFVSGTASIVGHETLHAGDPAAQTRESFANMAAVLEETNRVLGTRRYSLEAMTFKVYVRRPADLACIAAETAKILPAGAPIVYLRADVCRADLLVEIEASGRA
jgi:enamine deaminase RidA (YjgF/YER057c/UK114 family)